MKTLNPLFIVSFSIASIWAFAVGWTLPDSFFQSTITNSDEVCASETILAKTLESDPKLAQHLESTENHYINHIQNLTNNSEAAPEFILPIVVHIIHDGGPENISDDQVLAAIQNLNEAYENINYYDQNTGVDTKIQFCLARQDPDEELTSGINRVQSPLTNLTTDEDIQMKNLIRWEPEDYINVWVVNDVCFPDGQCGLVGYAYFPASHGSTKDGIVIEADFFGSTEGKTAAFIHEMGHYLGLYHTFRNGCLNVNCLLNGDKVCDTPPDQSTAAVPCGGSVNTCTTDTNSGFSTDQNDLFWNYMDYGDVNCFSAFTQGQSDRMHFFIENYRQSLLQSKACLEPCSMPIVADFDVPGLEVDLGSTVDFENTSLFANIFEWEIDGIVFSNSQHPSYTFDEIGVYEITLTATSSDPACYASISKTIVVICPIEADFSISNNIPAPGDQVLFTSTSFTPFSTYEWTINGEVSSNNYTLLKTFPQAGIYTICLSIDNGLCEVSQCHQIYVYDENQGCTSPSFAKWIGDNPNSEGGICIIPSEDGNFYIAGFRDQQTIIVKIDFEGNIIWSRAAKLSPEFDRVSQIRLDSDNMIVGCGHSGGNNPEFRSLAFKYDPVADEMLWVQQFENRSRGYGILESTPGGNYIMVMHTWSNTSPGWGDDPALVELDRETGNLTGLSKSYHGLRNEIINSAEIHDNHIYAVGTYSATNTSNKTRVGLTKFDLSGNVLWTKLLPNDPAENGSYEGIDFVIESGSIYIAFRENFFFSNVYLAKTNMEGELDWAKQTGSSFTLEDMVSTLDGFVFYGQGNVLKTDKLGNPVWNRKAIGKVSDIAQSQIIDAGGYLFFVSERLNSVTGSSSDIGFFKADITGRVGDGCIADNTIILPEPVSGGNYEIELTEYPSPAEATSALTQLESLDIEETLHCQSTCETTCDLGYVYSYEDENNPPMIHSFVSPGTGAFFIGGSKGDSSLLLMLNDKGKLLKKWTFDFLKNNEEFIDQLFIASDGQIFATGKHTQTTNKRGFYFKFDYLNEIIGFQKTWTSGNVINLNGITEKPLNNNFILTGTEINGNLETGIMMEVHRITGNSNFPINKRVLNSPSPKMGFTDILTLNDQFFIGGYALNSQNLEESTLFNLDDDGVPVWSTTYNPALVDFSNGYVEDMIIENNSITMFSKELGSSLFSEFYYKLTNLDFAGNVNWSSRANIFSSPIAVSHKAKISPLTDGYLASVTQDEYYQILSRLDSEGLTIWAKRIEVNGSLFFYSDNEHIFFAGNQNPFFGQNNKIVFGKMDMDGALTENCTTSSHSFLIFNAFTGWETDLIIDSTESFNLSVVDIFPEIVQSPSTLIQQTPLCDDVCLEVCNNNDDDDSDGLIDNFDPDCDCELSSCGAPFYRQCLDLECDFGYELDSIQHFAFDTIWQANFSITGKNPAVGDVDGDCIPDIVFGAGQEIRVLDGVSGEMKYSFTWDGFSDFINGYVSFKGTPALGDVDLDGQAEIFVTIQIKNDTSTEKKLSRFDFREAQNNIGLSSWWFTDDLNDNQIHSPALANFDAFGNPEVYIGNQVFNCETGLELANGGDNNYGAFGDWQENLAAGSIAADVLSLEDCEECNGMELIAGNQVYTLSLVSYQESAYNKMTLVRELPGFHDGMTQLADFDNDGDLDAIVSVKTAQEAYIYVWDLQTETLIGQPFQAQQIQASALGKPSLGDVDGDGWVEIIVHSDGFLNILEDYQNGGGNNWGSGPNTLKSKKALLLGLPSLIAPLFDINNDDKVEILAGGLGELGFLDENLNWVGTPAPWNASTGFFHGNYPIIVDLNNDGFTEILLTNGATLFALCPSIPLPRTRPIWNQFNYFVTNVLDDGRIPFQQQNHHGVANNRLNGFLLQQPIYNQDSLPIFNATDLVLSKFEGQCFGDSITLEVIICNEGDFEVLPKMPLTLYNGDPFSEPSEIIVTYQTNANPEPGECIFFSFQIPTILNTEIYAVLNDGGTNSLPLNLDSSFPNTYLPECDYSNNFKAIELSYTPPILDLGADTLLCNNGIVGLNAGSQFLTYRWQDGSEDSLFTTWLPGTFWVEATDSCGGVQRDTVIVEMESTPNLIDNQDTIICIGDALYLSAKPIFENIEWFPKNLMNCDTCLTQTIFPDTSVYIFALGSTLSGCASVDTFFVEVTELEIKFETNLSCNGNPDGSIIAEIIGGNSPYNFYWEGVPQNNAEITNLLPGEYFLTVEDQNGCQEMGSIILEQTNTEAVDLVIEHVSCFGASDGAVSVVAPNENLKVSLLQSDFQSSLSFANLPPGSYDLSVLDTNDCITTQEFFIEEPSQLLLELPADITIQLGESYQINPFTNASQNAHFQWNGTDFLDCDICSTPIASPTQTITYTLQITEETGCKNQDEITISVLNSERVYVPNVFSPNSDGLNDRFYPFAAPEVLEIQSFKIFDRWGALVHEAENFPPNDPTFGWDGTFEGKLFNSAVFVYFIEVTFLDGTENLLKGEVLLMK